MGALASSLQQTFAKTPTHEELEAKRREKEEAAHREAADKARRDEETRRLWMQSAREAAQGPGSPFTVGTRKVPHKKSVRDLRDIFRKK